MAFVAPDSRSASAGFADSDLIARVMRDDDRNAFAELVRRHQSVLRASLRKMTGGQFELADDIAQETFILAWKNIRHFRFEAKFNLAVSHRLQRLAVRGTQEARVADG